jgi:hypothetical protein
VLLKLVKAAYRTDFAVSALGWNGKGRPFEGVWLLCAFVAWDCNSWPIILCVIKVKRTAKGFEYDVNLCIDDVLGNREEGKLLRSFDVSLH